MPNWCNNSIKLHNCDEPFDQVVKDYLTTENAIEPPIEGGITETILDFNKIVPMPEELKNTTSPAPKDINPELQKTLVEKYGADNWYDWCVKNWGTKWNCCDPYLADTGMSFTTAWSPPCPVIVALAKKLNKDIRMTYIEEGMAFCGEFFAYADGTSEDNEYDISNAPQELLDEVGYEEWEEVV
jgi:hypothetical protein